MYKYNIGVILYGYTYVMEGEMDYISVKEAAEKWAISERRIQKLCEDGRIDGVERFGRSWMIPRNSKKPNDLRRRSTQQERR